MIMSISNDTSLMSSIVKIGYSIELTEDAGDVPKGSKGTVLKIIRENGIIHGVHVELFIHGKRGTFNSRVPLSAIRII